MLFLIVLSLVNFYFDRLKLSIILIKLLIRIVFWLFTAREFALLIVFAAMVGRDRLAARLVFAGNAIEEQLARLEVVLLLRSAGLLQRFRLTVTIFTSATSLVSSHSITS